eukprot:1144555-Pelagomonas_calceolata.AAC.2
MGTWRWGAGEGDFGRPGAWRTTLQIPYELISGFSPRLAVWWVKMRSCVKYSSSSRRRGVPSSSPCGGGGRPFLDMMLEV